MAMLKLKELHLIRVPKKAEEKLEFLKMKDERLLEIESFMIKAQTFQKEEENNLVQKTKEQDSETVEIPAGINGEDVDDEMEIESVDDSGGDEE